MFHNYLIVASKKDTAGMNIANQLNQFGKFNFYLVDEEIIYTENLDMNRINQYDFIIFASKHKSEKGIRSISIHAPGNWREAELGGEKGKICPASALFMKQLFEKLRLNMDRLKLEGFELTLECTHHGPLINKPCVFVEIGSNELEWKDRRAGFCVARAIHETLLEFKENDINEIAFGIGGPHYCPNFNSIQLESNVAIAHIIPQYALPLKEEMIQEIIKNTKEEIDFALLDWKGLGDADKRKQVTDILDKFYIRYETTSDINKR